MLEEVLYLCIFWHEQSQISPVYVVTLMFKPSLRKLHEEHKEHIQRPVIRKVEPLLNTLSEWWDMSRCVF